MAFGPDMTDEQFAEAARERGFAEHVAEEGPEGLIGRWVQFVAEVEEGYSLGLEDYRNDLDTRMILAEFGLDMMPAVQQADDQLRGLLTNLEEPLWREASESSFWLMGYPTNARGELLEDLRAEGLVGEGGE